MPPSQLPPTPRPYYTIPESRVLRRGNDSAPLPRRWLLCEYTLPGESRLLPFHLREQSVRVLFQASDDTDNRATVAPRFGFRPNRSRHPLDLRCPNPHLSSRRLR